MIGVSVSFFALFGFIVVLIFGFVGGVSLGSEYSIMIVNIVFAVVIGVRLLSRVNRMEWIILVFVGIIGVLFGIFVAAALIFS